MKENLFEIYSRVRAILIEEYGSSEASAQAFVVLEDLYGVSRADVLCRKEREFSEEESETLAKILGQLSAGIPLQYAMGKALFFDRYFHVRPGVLIPRPETEALVEQVKRLNPKRIVDCGTGSGCIAVTIALELPEATVEAWDISEDALSIAQENARLHEANVNFVLQDMLAEPDCAEAFDCIVSNPPYICEREREEMEAHVLNHEPHLALFVPDEDPLRFYRALARLGQKTLVTGGHLLVETNRSFTPETAALFVESGYQDVEIIADCFDVPRFVKARKG